MFFSYLSEAEPLMSRTQLIFRNFLLIHLWFSVVAGSSYLESFMTIRTDLRSFHQVKLFSSDIILITMNVNFPYISD